MKHLFHPHTRTRKLNLSSKFLITSTLILALISICIGGFFYDYYRRDLARSLQRMVMELAQVVSANLDGDLHETFDISSIHTEEYLEQSSYLADIMNISGLAYAYTYVPAAEGELQFILSNEDAQLGNYGDCMGLRMKANEYTDKALSGTACFEDGIYSDEWGMYFSGYAPIYNSKQEVVAAVGVDYSACSYLARLKTMVLITCLLTFACWIVSVIIVLFISLRLQAGIVAMIDRVDTITNNDGDLTQRIELRSGDELELMADKFNYFLEKMRSVLQEVHLTTKQITEFSKNTTKYFETTSKEIYSINTSIQNLSSSTEEIYSSMDCIASSGQEVFSYTSQVCLDTYTQTTYCAAAAKRAAELKNYSEEVKASTVALITKYRAQLEAQLEKADEITKMYADTTGMDSLSPDTAKDFDGVHTEVIEVIHGLSALGSSLIAYIDEHVLADYDSIVSHMEQYHKDATAFQDIMSTFHQNALNLQLQFTNVNSSIEAIACSLVATAAEAEQVTFVTENLNNSIHMMKEQVTQNQSIVNELQETLDFFTI